MKTLAFELSSGQGGIALLEDGAVLFERGFPNDRKDSGAFFENVQLCLQQFGAPGEIVVGLGPGSYAGVRIAIATALGLRTAVNANLAGIASICAIDVEDRDYCVIGDARRQSFYLARVSNGRLVDGPALMSANDLETRISTAALPVYSSERLPQFPLLKLAYPSARRLAELPHLQSAEIDDTRPLEPIYLREPHITTPKEPRAFAPTK
ncbi:MAG TPA: tRNA (adenosine(37)-N6)-threonylcarbamoyltransferase complex dimerization subunit type 1 TsaB [Chthoniobacterales bacterium]|nr:tRNA (adenosine(37)-N6)-threonylcarbamoyltransferase complex dimerization subunit type 1 TsaB [Chthoniobacterales bacterium]